MRAFLCTALALPPTSFRAVDIHNGGVSIFRNVTKLMIWIYTCLPLQSVLGSRLSQVHHTAHARWLSQKPLCVHACMLIIWTSSCQFARVLMLLQGQQKRGGYAHKHEHDSSHASWWCFLLRDALAVTSLLRDLLPSTAWEWCTFVLRIGHIVW